MCIGLLELYPVAPAKYGDRENPAGMGDFGRKIHGKIAHHLPLRVALFPVPHIAERKVPYLVLATLHNFVDGSHLSSPPIVHFVPLAQSRRPAARHLRRTAGSEAALARRL